MIGENREGESVIPLLSFFCLQIFADYVLHDMIPENLELVSNSTTSELPTQPTCLAFFLLLFGGALRLANPSFIFLLMLSYLHTTLISSKGPD
jgi:hypothetical protein